MTFDPVAFAAAQRFRRARASANPHEYIVREKVADDPAFDAFVRHIRTHGTERAWGFTPRSAKRYIVWYAPDGFHYWTMGWPLNETLIINRARSADEDQTFEVEDRMRYSSPNGRRPVL